MSEGSEIGGRARGSEESRAPSAHELHLPVSVQVERREPVNAWAEPSIVPVGVSPGRIELPDGAVLVRGERSTRHHAGNAAIVLHRKTTEGVLSNLSSPSPTLYVVMRPSSDAPMGVRVHLVTASDHEAQDHADAGEDMVERVPMPPELRGPIETFVAEHHRDEPTHKRKRKTDRPDEHKFGQQPIFETGPKGGERR